jgi:hypothetical protein
MFMPVAAFGDFDLCVSSNDLNDLNGLNILNSVLIRADFEPLEPLIIPPGVERLNR